MKVQEKNLKSLLLLLIETIGQTNLSMAGGGFDQTNNIRGQTMSVLWRSRPCPHSCVILRGDSTSSCHHIIIPYHHITITSYYHNINTIASSHHNDIPHIILPSPSKDFDSDLSSVTSSSSCLSLQRAVYCLVKRTNSIG